MFRLRQSVAAQYNRLRIVMMTVSVPSMDSLTGISIAGMTSCAEGEMELMWQTQEVIRRLEEEADREEIKELIEEAEESGRDPEDAVFRWVRSGAAPKSLHDTIYRFSTQPSRVYAFVEWDEVVQYFSSLAL